MHKLPMRTLPATNLVAKTRGYQITDDFSYFLAWAGAAGVLGEDLGMYAIMFT